RENARDQRSPEKVWDDFTVYLERLISVQKVFDSGASLAESACAGLGYGYASLALLRAVIGGVSVTENAIPENNVSGSDVFETGASGADAVSLALHWQLDRKLREILCRLGMDEESAWHAVEIMKVVLSRRGKRRDLTAQTAAAKPAAARLAVAQLAKTAPDAKAAKQWPAQDLARQVILDNYGDDDFRRILGINVFDDVTWFNKEAFEQALHYGSIYAAMENEDAALVKDAAAELQKAERRSGYRLDALIEALSPDAHKRGKSRRVK
ncbi:MAG: hypothetical protein LBC31_07390, partial [Treponema sp.]|nr:hypothetical protein [Treponema sp.]